MEETLSRYFGRPTKSNIVQVNMQQQHSLAPIRLRTEQDHKKVAVLDTLTNKAPQNCTAPINTVPVGCFVLSNHLQFRPFATCRHCISSIKYTFSTFKMNTLH